MPRSKHSPGVISYYETLQDIFSLESRVLTGVLPHAGERGRNDEERFRAFLERVLPRRFSIGSGFIVCSEPSVPPSSQTDVVIFDEIYNSPLHRELAAFVYPVEMVYGTVEVKGTLTRKNLLKACRDIRKMRQLGQHQHYVEYTSVAKNPSDPTQTVVARVEQPEVTPPRAFVFAYDKSAWKGISDLVSSLQDAVSETGAHIHGLAILRANWYVAQEAYTSPARFHPIEGNALMHFVRGMLHSIASRRVRQASIDRYLGAAAPDTSRHVVPSTPSKPTPRPRKAGRRRAKNRS